MQFRPPTFRRLWARRQLTRISTRDPIPGMLTGLGLKGTGVEVGIQLGAFSELILESWPCHRLYSVDSWTTGGSEYVEWQIDCRTIRIRSST